jgi:hypothetical protein
MEHSPLRTLELLTVAVPVPAVVGTNGRSELFSKLVLIRTDPLNELVGVAVPARQVAALAAGEVPRKNPPVTSAPTVPMVPNFFSLLIW